MYASVNVLHENGSTYGYQHVLSILEHPSKTVVYERGGQMPPEPFREYLEGDVEKIWATYSDAVE